MGLFDKLLSGSNRNASPAEAGISETVRGSPFNVSMSFMPFRLAAMRDNSVNLIVKITNITSEKQLVSFEVLLPRKELLGFDPTAINKYMDKKIGDLEPGETKEVAVTIWGTNQTKQNNYPFEVTVYAHYLNYEKVINYIKKRGAIRVV